MSSLPQPPRALFATLCAGLLLATPGCVAPQPHIVLNPSPVVRHPPTVHAKQAARPPRCEPPAQVHMTDAEKTRLFAAFDGWKDEQRSPGTTADTPLPPPAPVGNHAAPPGCRVSRN